MKENGRDRFESVEAVIFDLDGTIRHNQPRGVDVFHQYVAESGVSFTEEQRKSAERWLHYYWAQSPELVDDVQKYGDSETSDFWFQHAKRHLSSLGVSTDEVEDLSTRITKRMRSEYQSVDCVPDDVLPTLKNLKESGYKLAVVSNRNEVFSNLLEDLGLLGYFDFTLAAGEVGWWKPDPRLLKYAVESLETRPDSAVYVGDNYFADVLGARKAGLIPVLVDPFAIYARPDCFVISKISEVEAVLLNGGSQSSS